MPGGRAERLDALARRDHALAAPGVCEDRRCEHVHNAAAARFVDIKPGSEHAADVALGEEHGRLHRGGHLGRPQIESLVAVPLWRHAELTVKRDGGVPAQSRIFAPQMLAVLQQQIGGWRRREVVWPFNVEPRTAVWSCAAQPVDGTRLRVRPAS